jgi:hypothetical protein
VLIDASGANPTPRIVRNHETGTVVAGHTTTSKDARANAMTESAQIDPRSAISNKKDSTSLKPWIACRQCGKGRAIYAGITQHRTTANRRGDAEGPQWTTTIRYRCAHCARISTLCE